VQTESDQTSEYGAGNQTKERASERHAFEKEPTAEHARWQAQPGSSGDET
jgi:hypothetical protein